VKKKEGD